MAWIADQTRKTPRPAISRAAPAIRASAVRADRHPRAGPSATDARLRRGSLPKGSRQSSENPGAKLRRVVLSLRKMVDDASDPNRPAKRPVSHSGTNALGRQRADRGRTRQL